MIPENVLSAYTFISYIIHMYLHKCHRIEIDFWFSFRSNSRVSGMYFRTSTTKYEDKTKSRQQTKNHIAAFPLKRKADNEQTELKNIRYR